MIRNDATQKQVDAADPGTSTWLAANAGSGKTRVLTDRVARLLLEGVLPEHILCLTYTKAAATEMQNRLFKRLGGWAMLEDADLTAQLADLGHDRTPDADFLRQARTLFARAIETPGGLRIQTIHSFCASLLRRFPLEAGVSPQFTEMEDRAAEILRGEILDRMADGAQAHLVQAIAPYVSGDDPARLLGQIARRRDAFWPPRTPDAIRSAYGLPADAGEDHLLAQVFLGSESALAVSLIPALEGGGKTDKTLADKLSTFPGPTTAGLDLLESALLTQSGTILKTLGTKGARANAPEAFDQLDQLATRVEEAKQTKLCLQAADRDIALHAFAQAFIPEYEAEKTRRGWLDFDDLITRTQDLLENPGVADWVLYRLDGGIDHILVDEAQDTSPAQWTVIERLAREFTAGEGARADTRRTIFVVGDKKQSIYSFQGADPSEFDRMREEFRTRLRDTDAPLSSMELEYSFRSAEPILRLVDQTFEGREPSGFTPDQKHIAFKDQMPGRVDLWPLVEKTEEEEDGAWYDPVDRVGSRHHDVILANRIARFVARAIADRAPLPIETDGTWTARPIHAGDFLVLVRRRGRLFTEIIRACKQLGVPIAGADRLKVMAELAVRDIVALLSFLATPEDDLSLATVLRSPLMGLSEQQLFDLAHRRDQKYLWPALRDRGAEFPKVMAVLNDLRDWTDYLRPYDLIERILTRHSGRRLLIGRLGPEAEDGVNALLQQALAYEATEVPSLTGFLHWVQADDLTIKRAPESAGDRLRVMTVHGAKGLEAPVVIMPDCAKPDETVRDELLTEGGDALWKQPSAAMPARQQTAQDAVKEAAARERDRLLYVGLTRAEHWLIVAASGDLGKDGKAWHDQVGVGMDRSGALPHVFDFGRDDRAEGLRLEHGNWDALPLHELAHPEDTTPDLPEIYTQPATPAEPHPEPRSPSDLGGPKALPGADGDTTETAMDRGTALHALLEWLSPLPPEDRSEAAQHLIPDHPEAEALRAEALATLAAPEIAPFFAPGTLAEVPVTADLPGLGRIHGVIDRLIVTDAEIIAVDFKSNRTVPASAETVPDGLLRQMGAYAAALAQIWPDRTITTGLIWTRDATYMRLPHALVMQALDRATVA